MGTDSSRAITPAALGVSPQFTSLELGHATDTTLTRTGAGDVAIEGNAIYRAGGTDVPVADGGTGVGTLTDGGPLVGSGTGAITAMAVGSAGQVIMSNGTGDPSWVAHVTEKNTIINGDFSVAQRGTSFTSATVPLNSDDNYLLDRWILLSDGNDIVDVTQQSSGGVSGNENYIRLDVETTAKKFGILQVVENKNCKGLIGKTASLSFEAKVTNVAKLTDIRAVVIAWDSTADTVTSDIVSTWNAEGTRPTLVANWTAENTDSDLGVTASWVKYTIENISIDTASTTNVGVFIYQNDVATNDTAGIFLEITNVQLEKSSVATDFEYRQFSDELARCQRYYYRTIGGVVGASMGYGQSYSTTASQHQINLPVTMRIAPTALEQSGTATDYRVTTPTAAWETCSAVPTFLSATNDNARVTTTVAANLVAGSACAVADPTGNGFLGFSAEL